MESMDHLFVLQNLVERGRTLALSAMDEERLTPESIDRVKQKFELSAHEKAVFEMLRHEKHCMKLNRCAHPLASEHVHAIVRDTLMVDVDHPLSDREIRIAVLSALLTPLRQSVGSCFATAPAILIQAEQPVQLLHDLFDLITLGRLSKTIEGEEIRSPIALSYGVDVVKQPLSFDVVKRALQHPALQGKALPQQLNSQESLRSILEKVLGLEGIERVVESIEDPFRIESNASRKKSLEIEAKRAIQDEVERDFNIQYVNPLLKVWEFTLASFTDYQIDAFKWNLLIAMGFDPKMENGVGKVIFSYLEERLKLCNEEQLAMQQEVERSQFQLEAAQALLKSATSEDRVRRLKVESDAQLAHLKTSQEMLHQLTEDAQETSKFYVFMSEQYEQLFRLYFQEVYDPDLRDVEGNIYEDSPAGFRLVYKYGRAEPSVWQPIYQQEGYIKALHHFFRSVEPILVNQCVWEKGKDEIHVITRLILEFIETDEFIKGAFKRVKEKQDSASEKKPWSYISGGTLDTLVRCYVGRTKPLTLLWGRT